MTSRLSEYLKRSPLPLFFLLSLIISWAIWVPQAAVTLGITESAIPPESPLMLLSVWGPGLAAIIVALLMAGKAGLRKLFHPIRYRRVGIQWYLLVLFYPAVIWLVGRAIDTLFGQSYELTIPILTHFGPEQAMMVPVALLSAFPNTLGEELGWRGFALPKLQAKYNALVSSIILGLFWGFWHIPLWIGYGQMGLPLLVDVLTTVASAILFTWVYNNTSGSLLLAWLFHWAMTITQYFLAPLPTLTDDILRWSIVVLVVIIARPAHLSQKRITSR